MSHVLEHIDNGENVIIKLTSKLKPYGIIYVETPSPRSVSLPSMRDTLNFYDDPSHIRVYKIDEVTRTLNKINCSVLKAGIRHDNKRILFLPIYAVISKLKHGYVTAGVVWDLFGFASYVIARKN